ncbi:uncharacterized protein BX664DRAFT_286372 [Halteromyces radiatus]|uniref:uncharacterized protein n=1 Tax=Halteromyces radiatus TaxID=101107 RepID=UPI00221EA72E|nr:uncharacterized protein BX664DRAFT_286372 [Halteromyces radiatus]KAI8079927.1 hypothetical protein BX664DRAFT_286372 [Halteromyces radiatus]
MSTKHRSRLPSVAPSRADTSESASLGSRQRQSKKDEAIRRKLEQELSKKKQSNSRGIRHGRKVPGTVSALRPTQALTVKEHLLVIEASQLMAAKRGDCVLVVDENDHLSGIFTAKDIAYRVVAANGIDPRTTTVADIMTKMPMCVTADTSATDALNLMVSRGFRHLPVCNEEGDIFGLLDITKCLYEALDKMERAFGSSQKLYDALQGVEREWSSGPVQLVQYMEALRDRMSCPDLNSVMDGNPPAEVNVKTNVREVARLMKEHHTTAVLVTDREGLAGIFTTKDIVLRVVAAGLSPDNCSVVRVMTPNPDCADPQTTIMEALRRMNDGHYLNLPVLEEGSIVGMVDVLKLTYATLEQINSIQGSDGEGPMWSRFWDSFGENEHTETESQLSDSLSASHTASQQHHHRQSPHQPRAKNAISPDANIQEFPEITPNESASMVAHNDDNQSATSSHQKDRSRSQNKKTDDRIAFKYKLPNGQSHRFMITEPTYQQVLDMVRPKLIQDHLAATGEEEDDGSMDWLTISYVDDEDDQVLMTSDSDVRDALQLARKAGKDRIMLFVVDRSIPNTIDMLHGYVVEQTVSPKTPTPIEPLDDKTQEETHSDVDEQIITDSPRKSRHRTPSVEIAGIPQELFLPAAITFLGVAILGVFAFSRMKPHYR